MSLFFGNWEPRKLQPDHSRNRARLSREGSECRRGKRASTSNVIDGGFRIEEEGGLWFLLWLPAGWVPGEKTWGLTAGSEREAEATARDLTASMRGHWEEVKKGRNAASKKRYANKVKGERAMSSEQVKPEAVEGGARIKDEHDRVVMFNRDGIKMILATTRSPADAMPGVHVLGLALVRESFDLKEIDGRSNKVFRGGFHEIGRLEAAFDEYWGLT